MKFEVHGVDRESGAERIEVIEAGDEREAASKAAGLGMYTSKVVPVREPQPDQASGGSLAQPLTGVSEMIPFHGERVRYKQRLARERDERANTQKIELVFNARSGIEAIFVIAFGVAISTVLIIPVWAVTLGFLYIMFVEPKP